MADRKIESLKIEYSIIANDTVGDVIHPDCYVIATKTMPGSDSRNHSLSLPEQALVETQTDERNLALELPGDQSSDNADDQFDFGNAAMNRGDIAEATLRYRRAIMVRPDFAGAHFNLGNAYLAAGKFDAAITCFRQSLEFLPNDADGYNNLGHALQQSGNLDEAVLNYKRALELRPNYAEAHSNLGNAMRDLQNVDAALSSYQCAIASNPNYAEAYYNLGNLLKDLGRREEAIVSLRRALRIWPGFANAHLAIGNALQDSGDFQGAMANYQRAIEIDPTFAGAYGNLGNLHQDLGKPRTAVAYYRRSLALKPGDPQTHYNLANALSGQGELDDAIDHYRMAIEIEPKLAEAHCNLGNALKARGEILAAMDCYRRALEIKPNFNEAHSSLIFANCFLPNSAEALLAEARNYDLLVRSHSEPFHEWPNPRVPDRCLRVGIVSGDLRHHPVGYFTEAAFGALTSSTPGRIALFGYHCSLLSDDVTQRIKSYCQGWFAAAKVTDDRLAHQIRSDGIDILIDLAGHTAQNRLPMFALKPAPIQATWLGYLGSTGIDAMDYLIADSLTLPPGSEHYFSEEIWRLPDSYLCLTPPAVDVDVSPPPACANDFVTFGSFNNLAKINDFVVELWARVLAAVPNSRLFLKARQFKDSQGRAEFAKRFSAHGVEQERLILEDTVATRADNLKAYGRIDIALDTFPYPGITTTIESLWMGVPVLSLAGDSFISRQGLGLLTNIGLADWIAHDSDDFLTRAISFAKNIDGLVETRNRLRQQVLDSVVCDAAGFAKNLEAALREMWVRWCHENSQ